MITFCKIIYITYSIIYCIIDKHVGLWKLTQVSREEYCPKPARLFFNHPGLARMVKMKKIAKKHQRRMDTTGDDTKIEKKPLSLKERKKKMRKDMLRIARRYEEMKLYDDAIKYYKKLGLRDDYERVAHLKEETYIKKAKEFEAQNKYEDALRLYENLKLTDEVERLSKLMGKEDYVIQHKKPAKPESEPEEITEPDQETAIAIPYTPPADPGADDEEVPLILDEVPEGEPAAAATADKKVFKICPYCGEELNLPKKPNFCPYCTESLV
jgi:tetratricopeptide (TPR) repeat protein